MAQVVNFIPSRRLIEEVNIGTDNIINIDEIYSEWKVWYAINDNSKHSPALRTVGGDPITDVQNLGATFFLINGWRFKPAEFTHRLTLVGNWFTDPSGDFTGVGTDGNFQVLISEKVSNLTDSTVARLDLAQLQRFIYLDDVLGNDANPGTPTAPVRTISQGFIAAAENNLQAFSLKGSFVLDRATPDWNFAGTISEETAILGLGGYSVNHCAFEKVTLQGIGIGIVEAQRSRLDNVQGLSGEFHDCGISAFLMPSDSSSTIMHNCFSIIAGQVQPIFDLGVMETANFQLRGYQGGFDLRNVDMPNQKVSLYSREISITLDASNTDGEIVVNGGGLLIDNSNGSAVYKDGFVDARDVTNARKIYSNRQLIEISTNTLKIFDDDNTTVIFEYDLKDANGNPTSASIFERVPK
jgi:hypothetical protein